LIIRDLIYQESASRQNQSGNPLSKGTAFRTVFIGASFNGTGIHPIELNELVFGGEVNAELFQKTPPPPLAPGPVKFAPD
jgi:hypothetical protein